MKVSFLNSRLHENDTLGLPPAKRRVCFIQLKCYSMSMEPFLAGEQYSKVG